MPLLSFSNLRFCRLLLLIHLRKCLLSKTRLKVWNQIQFSFLYDKATRKCGKSSRVIHCYVYKCIDIEVCKANLECDISNTDQEMRATFSFCLIGLSKLHRCYLSLFPISYVCKNTKGIAYPIQYFFFFVTHSNGHVGSGRLLNLLTMTL